MITSDFNRAGEKASSDHARWTCPKWARLDLMVLAWGRRAYSRHGVAGTEESRWVYLYLQEGSLKVSGGSGATHLEPGEIAIFDPKGTHQVSGLNRAGVQRLVWAWRSPPRCGELHPAPRGCIHWKIPASLTARLMEIHHECRREIRLLDDKSRLALDSLHTLLDTLLSRSMQRTNHRPPSAMCLELAIQWMHENMKKQNPVASVCDYLHLSASTLDRIFRRHLAESPYVYYQRLRMKHARELLRSGLASVKEVAYNLGYRHPNNFSRAFKMFTEEKPRVHLKAGRREHAGI